MPFFDSQRLAYAPMATYPRKVRRSRVGLLNPDVLVIQHSYGNIPFIDIIWMYDDLPIEKIIDMI